MGRKGHTAAMLAVAGLALVSVTHAGTTAKGMALAAKAVHYPKAGALKVTCKRGTPYRCVATYSHHRARVFFAAWKGGFGGWICAGPKASSCTLLHTGFYANADVTRYGGVPALAQRAARGYMVIKYSSPQPLAGNNCPPKSPPTYVFCYAGANNTSIAVDITMRKVKTGYTFTAVGSTVPS